MTMMRETVEKRLHELYWIHNYNCSMAMVTCLSEFFKEEINQQTVNASRGLNGAGRFRGQCGLVEGALMFIGIYMAKDNNTREGTDIVVNMCHKFASQFTETFGSISCFDLRPNGFREDDPSHFCEKISAKAILFAFNFINKNC